MSLVTIIRYEPVKYLIQEDRIDEAILAVRQVYKHATNDQVAYQYVQSIR